MLLPLALLTLGGSLAAGGCRDTLDPFDRLNREPLAQLVTVADTILPDADTYLRQSLPNSNWGADTALQLGGGGKNRVLVRFDSTALRQVVGAGTLDSAWLEFTIQAGPSGWGSNERTVDLHRLKRPWTELGATWNCAVDANTANSVADCPTQGWDMTNNGNGTYHPVRTDRVTVNNGQLGIIRLNVTADVQGYLSGSLLSQGWVFRKTGETLGGEALVFSRESGSQPRLVLRVITTITVPALPPDSVPTSVWQAIHAPSNVEGPSPEYPAGIPRTLILVTFKENTPLSNKQAAIDAIGGQVVGGSPIGNGGIYYVTITGDGTIAPLLNAISVLKTFSDVLLATPKLIPLTPGYLRSNDGPGWHSSDWRIGPSIDSAGGANWGLEGIAAPMAWGCSNGDSLTTIGILDTQFDNLSEFAGVIASASVARFGTPGMGHGNWVLSALTARGNNNLGMTGVMWRSRSIVREIVTGGSSDPTAETASGISILTQQGARVINISQWLDWELYKNQLGRNRPIPSDTQHVNPILRQLVAAIRNANATIGAHQPLIITIAGNKPIDAYMNGMGGLVDSFPQQVLIVGASDSLRQLYDSSGRGPRVELVAPGMGVSALDRSGSVLQVDGTSVAAPLVAGVAGLLLSFDSTLTAAELKSLLINGAIRGGRTAGGIPILNAYESLKLAAERPGAPLCGNRLWTEGSMVKVQRGATTDTIRDVGAPLVNVTAMHGGKRLLYTTFSGVGALQYQNGAWVVASQLAGDTLYNGVTSAVSHDGDSIAYVWGWGGGPITVEIGAIGAPPAYTHTVALPVRTSNPICELEFNGTCQQYFDAGLEFSPYPADDDPGYAYSIQYSTAGDEVYLSVPTWVQHIATQGQPTNCPGNPDPAVLCYPISLGWQVTGATVYAINIRTGARRTVDTSPGLVGIWQVGVSESNQQLASVRGSYQYAYVRRWWLGTFGGPFGSFHSCAWEFTPINGVTTPAAQSFPLAPGTACTGSIYRGTFAPIRAASQGAPQRNMLGQAPTRVRVN